MTERTNVTVIKTITTKHLTTQQAAVFIKRDPSALRQAVKRGTLKAYVVGGDELPESGQRTTERRNYFFTREDLKFYATSMPSRAAKGPSVTAVGPSAFRADLQDIKEKLEMLQNGMDELKALWQ